MLKTALCFILVQLGISFGLQAQNYIPNYSFEDTSINMGTPLYPAKDWTAATLEGWNYFTPLHNNTYPDWGTPNNLAGTQIAKTGNAYVGINIYHLWGLQRNGTREYLQAKLKNPLQFDSTYCLQLYISLADSFYFASKNMLGIYFSSNAVSQNTFGNLPFTPQLVVSPNQYLTDKVNWVKIDLQYQATGTERYITIGNFNDTNYIDTTFVPGGGNQFFFAGSYYYLDDIWLSHCDSIPDSLVSLKEVSLKDQVSVFPNPFQNRFQVISSTNKALNFLLFNAMGQSIPINTVSVDQSYQIETGDLPKGLYWLWISDGNKQESMKLVKD